jgi:putative membrane protein
MAEPLETASNGDVGAVPVSAGADAARVGVRSSFYGRPFWWLLFAIALLAIPAVGAMWKADMTWVEIHPALNAMLNGTSALFLLTGYVAIRRRQIDFHRRCMVAAVTTSGVFLVSYLTRFATTGAHRYAGDGWDRTVYLFILFSHMVLAVVIVPLVLRALLLARRKRFVQHRGVARWLWPMWIYVSLTGVTVYVMLYHVGT